MCSLLKYHRPAPASDKLRQVKNEKYADIYFVLSHVTLSQGITFYDTRRCASEVGDNAAEMGNNCGKKDHA